MVARGAPAASSVIRRPVTDPPTNTSSPSDGRKSRAAVISWSRFTSLTGFSESPVQFTFGNLAFTNAAIPQRIYEDQIFIEGRISQGGNRRSPIQGLKRDTSVLALFIWPDRTW